ncbi:MAG: hypothetical protein OXS35_07765 [Dehalococcoidia bacterium]|nr:hypothetical protein [Dehalococcoidia bacterium]
MNPIEWLMGGGGRKSPVLLAVKPPRARARTRLGVVNILGSIAVAAPF